MPLAPEDIQAIRALVERDAEAVQRADWETVTRLFTADTVRFPPNRAPIRGRSEMRAWLESFPPLAHFAITADEIIGCDDLAFVRGAYAMTLARGEGTMSEKDRGHYLGLVRKQGDGSWLWSTDMGVSELPLR